MDCTFPADCTTGSATDSSIPGHSQKKNNNNLLKKTYGLNREDGDHVGELLDETSSYEEIRGAGDSGTVASGTQLYSTTATVDATEAVHEMHLALLYLLSNPDEFQNAVSQTGLSSSATTLQQWNAEYDNESLETIPAETPLPYVVFADDAEVVLPQAHTASQLFGIETVSGMELEAAAGVPALSRLFLRWLGKYPTTTVLSMLCTNGSFIHFRQH